ncbi:hypothetical protein QJS66_12875 [Kocuria rhizophila]|nr:hypothetical protein QJS66_12875 [Kocuria rhizophila]
MVAYDDAGGVMAARLVWMLRTTGHRAALLDSSLDALPAEERERHRAVLPAAEFTPVPWPRRRWPPSTRPPTVPWWWMPGTAPLHRARPGPRGSRWGASRCRERPVPGAPAGGRTLQPVEELRARFEAAGVVTRRMISYCGSGITACHNLLVAEHAGLGAGTAVITGSWSRYFPHGPPGGRRPPLNWPSGY